MNITYIILRKDGRVDREVHPYPFRPTLRKGDKLLRILVPEDCALFYPDRRVKAEVYVGRRRIR